LNPYAREDKQSKEIKIYDTNYYGEDTEKQVFSELKQCFGKDSEFKNVAVFSGWKDEGRLEKSVTREFDFVIVSEESKKIILMEVKRANNVNCTQLKKATSQLRNGYHLFREKIPFSKGWKFVSVVYLKKDEAKIKNEFVVGPNSSFCDFFGKHLKRSSESADHDSYKVMI